MKLGIQMYSLGDEQSKDFVGTLEKVKKIGYDGVEFCGYEGRKPAEVKKIMADIGLEAASCHIGIPKDPKDYDKLFEEHAEMGIPKVIIPWADYDSWFPRNSLDAKLEQINKFAEVGKKYGIRTGFHNHFMEFITVFGKTPMEHLFENTPDDFILEIDTCWAEYATNDAYNVIKKLSPKTNVLCHFKGLKEHGSPMSATLDKACIDFKKIAEFLTSKNAEWAIVEQEALSITSLEAAKINYDYIRPLL